MKRIVFCDFDGTITVIAIGDSITDLNIGLQASVIFARPPLAQYLDEYQKPYIPWNNFLQIRDYLAKSWS